MKHSKVMFNIATEKKGIVVGEAFYGLSYGIYLLKNLLMNNYKILHKIGVEGNNKFVPNIWEWALCDLPKETITTFMLVKGEFNTKAGVGASVSPPKILGRALDIQVHTHPVTTDEKLTLKKKGKNFSSIVFDEELVMDGHEHIQLMRAFPSSTDLAGGLNDFNLLMSPFYFIKKGVNRFSKIKYVGSNTNEAEGFLSGNLYLLFCVWNNKNITSTTTVEADIAYGGINVNNEVISRGGGRIHVKNVLGQMDAGWIEPQNMTELINKFNLFIRYSKIYHEKKTNIVLSSFF